MDNDLYVIFDGPPSHQAGRFVETETSDGRGVGIGEWIERPDGLWALRVPRGLLTEAGDIDSALVAVSKWVDDYNLANGHHPESLLWSRVAKVCEESGEAMSALLGVTGQNPRKGVYADNQKLVDELLDTAMAALGAVEHITGNTGVSRELLDIHIVRIARRAEVL